MQREATAVWRGEVKSGKGSLSTESTVLKEAQKQCKTAWSPFATFQNLSAKVLSKLAGENPLQAKKRDIRPVLNRRDVQF
jgi:hypothetical protein